jgi:phosphoglycolate phosphatase
MSLVRTIFFDLDGTLSDPKPGITRCIQYALSELGYPLPDAETLGWCIGPPLQQSFAALLQTADSALIQRAVSLYRDRYSTIGLFENALYPDIPATLDLIRANGYHTVVATSKPQVYAQRIVEHFSLSSLFDQVYGSELDGTRSHKGELIRYILQAEDLLPDEAIMIGDRKHDMIGATENRVWGIGVTYGYGSQAELETHGAGAIAATPAEILPLLHLKQC